MTHNDWNSYDKSEQSAIRWHILIDTTYDTIYNTSGESAMSKWDKLLSRILSLDKDMRFNELRRVLESYGYQMKAPGSGSSHCTFRKAGKNPITIPKHEPIKKVYVEMARAVVEEESNNEES